MSCQLCHRFPFSPSFSFPREFGFCGFCVQFQHLPIRASWPLVNSENCPRLTLTLTIHWLLSRIMIITQLMATGRAFPGLTSAWSLNHSCDWSNTTIVSVRLFSLVEKLNFLFSFLHLVLRTFSSHSYILLWVLFVSLSHLLLTSFHNDKWFQAQC